MRLFARIKNLLSLTRALYVLWCFFVCLSTVACMSDFVWPKQVTDQVGREINIPSQPKRIVSLAPSLTECLFALDQGDKVVGVTQFSNYPSQASKVAKIGSYVNLDLEKIVALTPDICLATKDGNPIEIVNRLKALDIPVYVVDPRDLSAIMDTLLDLGDLLQAQKQAKAVVERMNREVDKVKSLVSQTEYCPRVFFQIGLSPIIAVGTETFIHELINLAGGKNLTQGPAPYPRYSQEEVLSLRPDIIIITSMSKEEIMLQQVKKLWKKYPSIPAVENNQIYSINSDICNRASPRIIKGLKKIVRIIHPELFE